MNKKHFKYAISQYSKESGIAAHQLRHYLTDGRLIGILEFYDEIDYLEEEQGTQSHGKVTE